MVSLGSATGQALRNALRRMLRPLVRALIEADVTFPAFMELAREAYVDVAFDEFAIDGKTPTISRVMALTGIHRREVTRLAKQDRVVAPMPPVMSLGARVVAKWCADAAYLDAQHQPRPLPRSAPSNQISFSALVASVSKDIRPKSLLDEWQRVGVVTVDDKLIHLRTAALVPSDGYEEKAYYFGRNLRDHIATAAHNLAGRQPTLIDRSVYEDSLSDESLEELRVLCEQKGSDLLLEIYREVRRLAERDREVGAPDRRMTFGVYLFNDQVATAAHLSNAKPGPSDDAS